MANIRTKILLLILLLGPAVLSPARAAAGAPPPDKRKPLDVLAVMIYSAHERDIPSIMNCIDVPGFYQEYLSRTSDNPPLSAPAFEAGLLHALSGSYSPKLDETLKGLEGADKFRFIQMFVKAYADVETKGDSAHIVVRAQDSNGNKPEAFLKKTGPEWRITWVEPFARLRELFDDQQISEDNPHEKIPAPPAPMESGDLFDPANAEAGKPAALDLAPAKRDPGQVLATLLIGMDRRDWSLALQSFDLHGLRTNLIKDMPALDFLTTDKIKDLFSEILSRSKHDFGGFLPKELQRLQPSEKALMVELTVRALSSVDIHGATADITVQHPDKPDKKYSYKMKKTTDGWKIDVLSVFGNILDTFMNSMNRY